MDSFVQRDTIIINLNTSYADRIYRFLTTERQETIEPRTSTTLNHTHDVHGTNEPSPESHRSSTGRRVQCFSPGQVPVQGHRWEGRPLHFAFCFRPSAGRCHGSAGTKSAVREFFLISRLQYLKRAHQSLVYRHHCTRIVKFAAIVWCTEEGDQLALGEEFVSIFNNLMSSAYQIKIMLVQELCHNFCSKCKADSSIVFTPAHRFLVRIRPQQVA